MSMTQPTPMLVCNAVAAITVRITPLTMGYDASRVRIGIVGTM
jgi:hypothetical protein